MPLNAELTVNLIQDKPFRAEVSVRNTSQVIWLPGQEPIGGVNLGCHVVNLGTNETNWDFFRTPLKAQAEKVMPGETVSFTTSLWPLPPGEYELEFDLVAEWVAWFAEFGSKACKFRVSVEA